MMKQKRNFNHRILMTMLAFLFLALPGQADSSPCLLSTVSMNVGQTQVINSPVVAQAYYWTVSGPLVIQGSNTGSSVTVKATGLGNGVVTLTYFLDGVCYTCTGNVSVTVPSCSYYIQEWIPMCWGANASCWDRRGHYVLKCNNSIVNADWEVSPNNNGFCIYYGCSTPGTNRQFTAGFKPNPTCNWVGLNVTVRAYQPGTNTLLAAYNTVIQDCEEIFGRQNNSGGETAELGEQQQINLELPADGPVTITAIDLMTGASTLLFQGSGAAGTQFSHELATSTLEQGKLYAIRVQQNDQVLKSYKISLHKD